MPTKTYDPTRVVVQLSGFAIGGFAPGTFIEAVFSNPAFTTIEGCEGEVARTMSMSRAGTVKITLLSTSDDNATLSGFADSDRADGSGIFDLMIKDSTGQIQAHAPKAWIAKVPPLTSSGAGVTEREWVIAAQALDFTDIDPGGFPSLSDAVNLAIEGAKQVIGPLLPRF